uniref:Right handed beta helix domain-containing protein n=1 Tax=Amphimedon queenslandica TaxID=400682 RepID=A0A1X7TZ39_AMPQE
MNGLTISISTEHIITVHVYIGSGALMYFTNDYITDTHTVMISNSLITENIEDIKTQHFLRYLQNQKSVINAAGLTVLYTQTNYLATVSVFKTNFTINDGVILFSLHYKTNHGRVVFDQVSFESNIATIESSLILLLMIDVSNVSSPLHLDRSMFHNNILVQPESAHSSLVFISLYNPLLASFKNAVTITFSNSVFTKTSVTRAGSCIHATDTGTQDKVLNIYLTNITAYDNFKTNNSYGNTETEFIKIVNAKVLHIRGYNNFSYNFGSIFGITNSLIYLNGQLNIIGNNGYMGTGFKVQGSSYFLLSNRLNATFINNTALTIGGAIYAIADDDFNRCMFQNNTNNITNIKMTFINNTASEAGSSIYSNNLYECQTDSYRVNLMNKSNTIFSFFYSKHQNFSMPPTSLCWCDVDPCCNTNDEANEYHLSAFMHPGQNIRLQLAAVYSYDSIYAHIKQYSYAAVTFLLIDRDNVHFLPSWQVSANSANQALLEK